MNDTSHPSQPGESSEENEADTAEAAAIAHALDEWYTRLGRQFGPLTRPQRRMLRLLHVDTMVRVGDLGEQLGLTTAGTTRMLDKLEAMGYAARSRTAQHDLRQVYVTLTPAGVLALQEAERVFLARMLDFLSNLSPPERAMLAHLLRALSARQQGSMRTSERGEDQE